MQSSALHCQKAILPKVAAAQRPRPTTVQHQLWSRVSQVLCRCLNFTRKLGQAQPKPIPTKKAGARHQGLKYNCCVKVADPARISGTQWFCA